MIEVNEVHPSKDSVPIKVKPSGKMIEFKLIQPKKELAPINVILFIDKTLVIFAPSLS